MSGTEQPEPRVRAGNAAASDVPSDGPAVGVGTPSLPVSVVVVTRNRCEELLRTLGRLTTLDDRPEVVVVDNASSDGTVATVRSRFPGVQVVPGVANLGAAGRTVGVRVASEPVVAFADDDSWWAPGALRRAAEMFASHPGLGLINGRILVGPGGEEDDACREMGAAPLGRPVGLPGPPIMGHLACGTVVRRRAYLAVGGYSPVLGFGGEERLLALDLASAGWGQCYVPAIVAHHHPSPLREGARRRAARYCRNDALTDWLRLPAPRGAASAGRLFLRAATEPAARGEAVGFGRRWRLAVASRRPAPSAVVAALDRAARPPAG